MMKKILLLPMGLLFVAFPGRWATDFYRQVRIHQEVSALTDTQRRHALESIEARLTPPVGASLSQVEQVYGKSQGCGLGFGETRPDRNCRIIKVLSVFNRPDAGATLNIWLRNGGVLRADFSHSEQMHGLKQLALGFSQYLPDTPAQRMAKAKLQREMSRQQAIYRRNDVIALRNLLVVERLYWRALSRAAWQTSN